MQQCDAGDGRHYVGAQNKKLVPEEWLAQHSQGVQKNAAFERIQTQVARRHFEVQCALQNPKA